jgi:hypothetical protein
MAHFSSRLVHRPVLGAKTLFSCTTRYKLFLFACVVVLLLFAQTQQMGTILIVGLQLYELHKRGFANFRSVLANTPMEDLCFLMSAKFHLSGLKMSTFASWAVLLSNATKQHFHAVKSSYDEQVVR